MRKNSSVAVFIHLLGLFLLCITATTLMAQANRATITGTITDSSGAVVPNVAVAVVNMETNVAYSTVSNNDGIYTVPNLFPGTYAVSFNGQGFQELKLTEIRLISTQVAKIDGKLQVAATSSSVTVIAAAPLLDQEVASIGTNMKATDVDNLPLSIYGGGRFIEDFAIAMTPGYSPISSPYGAVVNGGQWFTKEFTIDGTSGTANIQGNSMMTGPTMEAVQELQAQTSGLDSQSGVTGGGVMSFNLKSGTNRFHGSAFNYGHNEILDANTWTNNSEGKPKQKKRAWDYGGSIGGPIIKDKMFFFGAIERYQDRDFRLGSYGATVPTDAMMSGDLSNMLGANLCSKADGTIVTDCGESTSPVFVTNNAGQEIQARVGMIFDPLTGKQFTGNLVPSDRISSVAQKINSIYKQYYSPQSTAYPENERTLISGSPTQTPISAVVKLDYNLSNRDHLSGSWIYNHKPRTLWDSGGVWAAGSEDGGPMSAARFNFYRSQEYRINESHSFTPTLLNVVNFTYNYDWQADAPKSADDYSALLGFGSSGAQSFPLISFGDDYQHFEPTFLGNTWGGSFSGSNYIYGDTLTWTKGKHTFTFGGNFVAHQIYSKPAAGALSFNFDANTTGAPSQPYGNYMGSGYASFLLGNVSTAKKITSGNLYGRQKSLDFFAQDSWKLRSNLTLNLGLRWDYNFRFHEKYGHWSNFDLNQIDPVLGIPGRLVNATGGDDSFMKNEYAANFAPQIGIAYSPNPKLVLRGSLGMIYNPMGVPFFNGVPNGFAPGFTGTNAVNTPFNWDQGYPGVFTPFPTDPTLLFPTVSVDPRALKLGYSVAMNFGAQYELTKTMRVEAGYIGNRGHRLTDTTLQYNQGSTAEMLRLMKIDPNLNGWSGYIWDQSSADAWGVKYPYQGFWGPVIAAIAPYPQMAAAAANYWWYPNMLYVGLPLGQSYYDSVVVDFVKRTGSGLTMDMSYTLSRQLGNTWSAQQDNNGYYSPVQDFSNVGQSARSLTGYDQTHVVKGFVSYELPFGYAQRWRPSNHLLNQVVGGWQLSSTLLYYSGQPFRVGANNQLWPQWSTFYPNWHVSSYTGPNDPTNFVPGGSDNFYMPRSVVSNPVPGHLGNGPAYVSQVRCPGQANENMSIMKNSPFGSDNRYNIQIRAEFYNLFNRHYYNIQGCSGTPAGIDTPDFGRIWGVADNPRNGQFGIRFTF